MGTSHHQDESLNKEAIMIFGIGTDIVEIQRIEKIFSKFNNRFAKKILSKKEYEAFQISNAPAHFLAKRFAAKEAVAKALGLGFRDPISFHGIEVDHNDLGAPFFNFNAEISKFLDQKKINKCHLSISDEKNIASAFVVLEA